jgi:hypothetical protein
VSDTFTKEQKVSDTFTLPNRYLNVPEMSVLPLLGFDMTPVLWYNIDIEKNIFYS